jgi:hypothetical protein
VLRSKDFAWDNIIDRLEDAYGELIGHGTSEHEVALAEA